MSGRVTSCLLRVVAALAAVVRVMAALLFRLRPALDRVGCVTENVQPYQRIVKGRTMGQAARDARRQLGFGETRQKLHRLPQPLDVLARHGQHAETDALILRVALLASVLPAIERAGGHEQRADQDCVRQLSRDRFEALAVSIDPLKRRPHGR